MLLDAAQDTGGDDDEPGVDPPVQTRGETQRGGAHGLDACNRYPSFPVRGPIVCGNCFHG